MTLEEEFEAQYSQPTNDQDEFEAQYRKSKLNSEMSHPNFQPESKSSEEWSELYGLPERSVMDSIFRNIDNTVYGAKQISGNTTREEDDKFMEREKLASRLTSWPTATGALFAEMLTTMGVTSLPRIGITKVGQVLAKKRLANPGSIATPFEEAVKSTADHMNYGIRGPIPIGTNAITPSAVHGSLAPLSGSEMENEWENRGKNALVDAIAGKTLDSSMSALSTLGSFKGAIRHEDDIVGGKLPYKMQFPRAIAQQDPVGYNDWKRAKAGKYDATASYDVTNSERRMQKNLENNVNEFRSALTGHKKSQEKFGYEEPSNFKPITPGVKTGEGWRAPITQIRKESARMLRNGKHAYTLSKEGGRIDVNKDEFANLLGGIKDRIYRGTDSDIPMYGENSLISGVKDLFKDLDRMAKGEEPLDVRRIMQAHQKLNRFYKSSGDTMKFDNAQLDVAKGEIDSLVDQLHLGGADETINQWRKGRQIYTDWHNKYNGNPMSRAMIDETMPPEMVAKIMFPRDWTTTATGKDRVNGIIHILKNNPEMTPYIKQDLFNAMSTGSQGQKVIDSKVFQNMFGKYEQSGDFQTLLDNVFSKNELNAMGVINNAIRIKSMDVNHPDFKPMYAPGVLARSLNTDILPTNLTEPNVFERMRKRFHTRMDRSGARKRSSDFAGESTIASDELGTALQTEDSQMLTEERRRKKSESLKTIGELLQEWGI